MSKKYLLQIPINAIYTYVLVLATWYIFTALTGTPMDAEGGAFLQSIYAPISTMLILVVIYTLSILDKSILSLAFIGIATVLTQLATLTGWSSQKVIADEYIFFAHLIALFIFAGAWHLFRSYISKL